MMPTPRWHPFLAELERRKVFRVAAVYGATGFVVLQAADLVLPRLGPPDWTVPLVVALGLAGLPDGRLRRAGGRGAARRRRLVDARRRGAESRRVRLDRRAPFELPGMDLPTAHRLPEARPAAEFLAERLSDAARPVDVLALGSLTNQRGGMR